MRISRSQGSTMALSVARAWKSGANAPVLKLTAVRTSLAPALTSAATASRIVAPESQVSSTTRTRLPRTSVGTAPKTAGVSRMVSAW